MPKPLLLLAPSEDKKEGGKFGILTETKNQAWIRNAIQARIRLVSRIEISKILDAKGDLLNKVLSQSKNLHKEIPLLPALERYQGVAFEALDPSSIPRKVWRQIFVLSNLRGVVRGDHMLPFYKLKMSSIEGLKAHLQKQFLSELQELPSGPVWSLLPDDQSKLIDSWERKRHTVMILDGSGKKISHWSKYYRGVLARWILTQQKGDPKEVFKAILPFCRISEMNENKYGGKELIIVTNPPRK